MYLLNEIHLDDGNTLQEFLDPVVPEQNDVQMDDPGKFSK